MASGPPTTSGSDSPPTLADRSSDRRAGLPTCDHPSTLAEIFRAEPMQRVFILAVAASVTVSAFQSTERAWETGAWAKPMTVRVASPFRNYAIETDKFRLDLQETIARGRQPITA